MNNPAEHSTSILEHLQRIDSLADAFESEWKSARQPLIENWLEKVEPALRSRLLTELLCTELEWKAAQYLTLSVEEYLQRFPGQHQIVQEAFEEWERSGYVELTADLEHVPTLEPEDEFDLPYAFGRYRLESKLGTGGFGAVYQATDLQLGRQVAIKLPHLEASTTARRRFLSEARAAGKLNHPGIVSVYDSGEYDGRLFIVSELIDGCHPEERVGKPKFSLKLAIRCLRDAARALHYAHQQGVIHRDIKPSNLLISVDDRTIVADFGLAKRLDDQSSLTLDGQLFGTPSYMSPEQAAGKHVEVGPLSDQYSLAVVMYELLTGKRPYYGSVQEVIVSILDPDVEPDSPRSRKESIPRELESICLKAMSFQPGNRYASLADFADDLERWARGEPVLARPTGLIQKTWKRIRRHPRVTSLIGVAVVASLIGAFALVQAIKEASRADEAVGTVAQQEKQLGEKESELTQTRTTIQEISGTLEETISESDRRKYSNLIRQVSAGFESGTTPGALLQELLQECPDPLRSWEWDYFHEQLRIRPQQISFNSESPCVDAKLGPDGKRLYTVDERGLVSAISITDDNRTLTWASGAVRPQGLAISQSGLVAVGSPAEGIAIRDRTFTRGQAPRFLGVGQVDGKSMRLKNEDFLYGSETARLKFATPELKAFVIRALKEGEQKEEVPPTTPQLTIEEAIERFERLPDEALNDGFLNRYPGLKQVQLSRLSNVGWALDFSPDSHFLAVGGDRFVQIWDLEQRERSLLLPAHIQSTVRKVSFSPDGKRLAAGLQNGDLVVWKASSGEEIARHNFESPIHTLSWTKDSRTIFSPARKNEIVEVDATKGTVKTFRGQHADAVEAITTSHVDRYCVSAAKDGEIRFWATDRLLTVAVIPAGDSPIVSLDFRSDDKQLLAVSEQSVSVWNIDDVIAPFRPVVDTRVVERRLNQDVYWDRFAISPDQQWIASVTSKPKALQEKILRIHHLHTAESVYSGPIQQDRALKLPTNQYSYGNFGFAPEAARFFMTTDEGLRYWDVPNWKQSRLKPGPEADNPFRNFAPEPSWLAISPKGHKLAIHRRQKIEILDTKTFRKELDIDASQIVDDPRQQQAMRITALQFSPDGRQLAVGTSAQHVGLFSSIDGKLLHVLKHNDREQDPSSSRQDILALAYSTDGTELACAGEDHAISVWNPNTGDRSGTLVGHQNRVSTISYHPQELRLVSGSHDGTLRLWETRDQSELITLSSDVKDSYYSQATFTPDGRFVIAIKNAKLQLFDSGLSAQE